MVAVDDPRLAKVGFAKLVGSGIELYAKKHEITLGRLSKSGHVDIVLGENMNISRQHAKIAYSKETGQWELHVLGKNGVTLHGTLLTPENPPHPLRSQDMIQIAEKQFHFLLPKDPQWPAHGAVSRPSVQQPAAPQMPSQSPAAAAQEAGLHSSAPAPASSLASVGPGHMLFQHLHKVLQPSLDRDLAAAATGQPSASAALPQQAQQASHQAPAGVSLPPSMARIAAALPPGQQQVMMQQMAMVMQKQMHMQQQQQAGIASDVPAHEQLQAMQAAQTQAGELMERLRAQGMAMNRMPSGQAPGMDRMPSGQAHGSEGA